MDKNIIFNSVDHATKDVKYYLNDIFSFKNTDIMLSNKNTNLKTNIFNTQDRYNNKIYEEVYRNKKMDENNENREYEIDEIDENREYEIDEIYENREYEIGENDELDENEENDENEIYIDEEIYNAKINMEDRKYKNIPETVYIEKIFSHLNIEKIIQLCGRNRIFNNICNNNIVWIYLLKRDFEITYKEENAKKKYMTYREYEILRHKVYLISRMTGNTRRKKSRELIYKYFGIKMNMFTGYKILFEKIIALLNKKFIFILDILSTYHLDGIANILSYHATYIKLIH